VRAAIIDGVDLIPVCKQTERVPVDVDDQPSRCTQLGKRRGADERFGGDSGHLLLLWLANFGQARTSTKV
jgi:hypothetical protein